ncbi:hypothetical protein PS2_000251 [Malus domestica]
MLDDLLEKKIIELPECKYHYIMSHLVGKCFVLKELIIKRAQQRKIELDLEDTAVNHTTTIVFGSFNPVPFQVTHAYSCPCPSCMALSAQPSLWVNDQNAPTDDEKGWTLVTYKKTRNPKPRVTRPKVEQGRKHHCRDNRKPKIDVKATKTRYAGEPMEEEPHIPVSLHEYFSNDFF